MNLTSVRMITNDIGPIVQFYEKVTGAKIITYTPDFAELKTPLATLAIGSIKTLAFFGEAPIAKPAANQSVIIEFRVEDVNKTYSEIAGIIADSLVQAPITMPWGNRSLLFKDPDGNLVNFFTPVTDEAAQRVDAGK